MQRAHYEDAWPAARMRPRGDHRCVVNPTVDWNATATPMRCEYKPPV